MPTLLLFADHDGVSTAHIAEFFALFGGGVKDPRWGQPKLAGAARDRARIHALQLRAGPNVARVIEGYLDQPTSKATQFAPKRRRAGANYQRVMVFAG